MHTGQHYDDELSQVFFDELGVPAPDRELGAGTGSNTEQTARILAALEPVLAEIAPDLVLVYGDTNSTLAGALAGAQAGVPSAHVEAGHALLRPHHARGAQPRADGPRERPAALLDPDRDGEPRARGRPRRGAPGGRRDGRRVAGLPRPGARALDRPGRAAACEPGAYLRGDRAPGGQRRPSRTARAAGRAARGAAGPVVFPVHPRTRARLEAAGLLERLDGAAAHAAARLPGLPRARAQRARGAHRLRRGRRRRPTCSACRA